MDSIHINQRPACGIVMLELPAGETRRGARVPGGSEPLQTQFLPAPFANGQTAGRLLVRIPEGVTQLELIEGTEAAPSAAPASFASLSGNELLLQLSGETLRLSDAIHSGWLHAGDGGNLNCMFETIDGDFPLFSPQSAVQSVGDGPLCEAVRVMTPLADPKSGAILNGCRAYYTLLRWKDLPLLSLELCFEAPSYTAARSIQFGRMERGKSEITGWAAGLPARTGSLSEVSFRTDDYAALLGERLSLAYVGGGPRLSIEEEEAAISPDGGAGHMVCRDLREFDATHPLSGQLVYANGSELDPAAWVGNLPCLVRARSATANRTLRCGDLTVSLHNSGTGLDLIAMDDAKSGPLLRASQHNVLFSVMLRDVDRDGGPPPVEYMVDACEGWGSVTDVELSGAYTFLFASHDNPALAGLTVILRATPFPAQSRLEWTLDVRLSSDTVSVVRVDPPRPFLDIEEEAKLLVPLGPGQAHRLAPPGARHFQFPYPSIAGCMQYMACWTPGTGRGLYYGLHDPKGSPKFLCAEKSAFSGRAYMGAMIPVEGIGQAGNGYAMEGEVVWQLFSGDWYDATVLFRDWVHSRAAWFTGVRAVNQPKIPEWLLKAPLWFHVTVEHGDTWVEDLLAAQEAIGVPAAAHVYQWHQIPFDTNYPHYNPAKECFLERVPRMQQAGIRVMPYINGRLWDTHDRGDHDYQFSSVARPFATKGRNGEVITERYNSKNSKGEPVELAVMCPSTALWQEKQMEINRWLLRDLGVDAVYIDQIAAAPAVNCMDTSHPHRPGGGAWWYEHYYNLIDHLNLLAPEDTAYTTESNAEPFVGHIDGMLVWHWSGDGNVPAFTTVYAGYQPMLGRNYRAYDPDDTVPFRVLTAQSLLFGDQPGWLQPSLFLNNPYKDFFTRAVQVRHAYGEHFYDGRPLRPPQIDGDAGILYAKGGAMVSPGVMGAVWKRERDGDTLLLLTNLTDEDRQLTISVEGGANGVFIDGLEGAFVSGQALTLPAQCIAVARLGR